MLDVIVGVLLLTAAGWGVNRALGVPAPRWSASDAHSVRREVKRYVKRRRKRRDNTGRKAAP